MAPMCCSVAKGLQESFPDTPGGASSSHGFQIRVSGECVGAKYISASLCSTFSLHYRHQCRRALSIRAAPTKSCLVKRELGKYIYFICLLTCHQLAITGLARVSSTISFFVFDFSSTDACKRTISVISLSTSSVQRLGLLHYSLQTASALLLNPLGATRGNNDTFVTNLKARGARACLLIIASPFRHC